MKVRVIKDFRPRHSSIWFRAGEEFEARFSSTHPNLPICDFQIISGPRSGDVIPSEYGMQLPGEKTYTESECETIVKRYEQTNQENLIHRENVRALTAERDKLAERNKLLEATRHYKEKIIDRMDIELKDVLTGLRVTKAEIERILDERDQLLEERNVLLQQIERTLDEQKPAIPRDVAAAIEATWGKYENNSNPKHIVLTNWRYLDDLAPDKKHVLQRFAIENPLVYMSALVNGYTVEQSPDELLRTGIKEVIDKWDEETGHGVFPRQPFLPDRITDFVQSVYTKGSSLSGQLVNSAPKKP